MRKIFIFFVAASLLIPLAGASATPITVDLWNAFPNAQGQNGFYAYGFQAGRVTPYRLLARTGDHAFTTPENEFGIPLVVKWSSPWLHLHPSGAARTFGPEHAVLAWRVPQTNTYTLSGQFSMPLEPPFGGGEVDVYIRQNNTIIWGPMNILITGSQPFNFQAILRENDLLYFGVDARIDDGADTTQLQGQISYNSRFQAGQAADLLLLD
jgi:hypothetical protein